MHQLHKERNKSRRGEELNIQQIAVGSNYWISLFRIIYIVLFIKHYINAQPDIVRPHSSDSLYMTDSESNIKVIKGSAV